MRSHCCRIIIMIIIVFGKLVDIDIPFECRSCLDFCLFLHFSFSFFFLEIFFGTLHLHMHACTYYTYTHLVGVDLCVCVVCVCECVCVFFLFIFLTNNLPAMSNKSFAIVELPHKHTTNDIHYTMAGDFSIPKLKNCFNQILSFFPPWYFRLYVLFLYDLFFSIYLSFFLSSRTSKYKRMHNRNYSNRFYYLLFSGKLFEKSKRILHLSIA